MGARLLAVFSVGHSRHLFPRREGAVVRGVEIRVFRILHLLLDESISNCEGLISLAQPIPQNRSVSQPSTAAYIDVAQ